MAADSVLFVGWNQAYPGHEKDAMEAFNSSVAFWMKQVTAGAIESFEPVVLEPHGGDLNGFMIMRGDGAKLQAIAQTEEWRDLLVRATLHVGGIGVIRGYTGEGTAREVARFQKAIS